MADTQPLCAVQGHGDVLSIDCNRLDSLDRLDTNREIGDTADQGTLPALLNKFGLRKGSRPTPTEGMYLTPRSKKLPNFHGEATNN